MARQTSQREDLMRDAVAMVDRVEFVSPAGDAVVVGFRHDGAISFYFSEEPVYQFSADRKLRRVYLNGIIKAECGHLTRWKKTYHDTQVQMLARELDSGEQSAMLAEMRRRLIELRDGLRSGTWKLTRQVSQSGGGPAARVQQWLEDLPEPFQVAESPRAR